MTFFDDDNQTPDAARALDAASGNIVGPAAGERATAPVVARGDAGPTPRPSEPQSADSPHRTPDRVLNEPEQSPTPRRCLSVAMSGFRCDQEAGHDGDHLADLPNFKTLAWRYPDEYLSERGWEEA